MCLMFGRATYKSSKQDLRAQCICVASLVIVSLLISQSTMKLCTVVLSVLALIAVSYAVENGPLMNVLQPVDPLAIVQVEPEQNNRPKRHLLLGAGALGAGIVGLGALGLGAGVIGAKAGLIGGALAGHALGGRSYGGRSYGGYGFGGGYGYGGGYGGYGGGYGGYSGGYGGYGYGGGYGGYGGGYGGYRRYYPTTYYVEDPWC